MRGKEKNSFCAYICMRITPAYAGKSAGYRPAAVVQTDHPRLCGEKCLKMREWKPSVGSPPPMRGKASDVAKRYAVWGITPAYAGKSRKPVHRRKPMQDHPRLCGEKAYCTPHQMFHQGSPPPMRGKD